MFCDDGGQEEEGGWGRREVNGGRRQEGREGRENGGRRDGGRDRGSGGRDPEVPAVGLAAVEHPVAAVTAGTMVTGVTGV